MDDSRQFWSPVVLWVGLLGALALSAGLVRVHTVLLDVPALAVAQLTVVLPLPPDTHLYQPQPAVLVTRGVTPARHLPTSYGPIARPVCRHMPKVHG